MNFRILTTRWQVVGREILLLLARIAPGALFWQSGRTKVDGWQLKDTTLYLFQEEYRLPLIDPALAASLAAFAEHLLPILLLLGLGTRFAAAGILGMTLVIQLFVYPDAWPTHGTWVVAMLLLIGQGGGRLSLDYGLQHLLQRHHGVSQNPCAGHADPEQCVRAPK